VRPTGTPLLRQEAHHPAGTGGQSQGASNAISPARPWDAATGGPSAHVAIPPRRRAK